MERNQHTVHSLPDSEVTCNLEFPPTFGTPPGRLIHGVGSGKRRAARETENADFVLGIWVVRENEGRCGEGRESANGADMRGAVGEGTRRRLLSTKRPEGFGRKIVAPRRGLESNLFCTVVTTALFR